MAEGFVRLGSLPPRRLSLRCWICVKLANESDQNEPWLGQSATDFGPRLSGNWNSRCTGPCQCFLRFDEGLPAVVAQVIGEPRGSSEMRHAAELSQPMVRGRGIELPLASAKDLQAGHLNCKVLKRFRRT